MRKVIFYFDHEWAFGSIHYELCKYLFKEGLNARVLPWDKSYSKEEFIELNETTDIFMTVPQAYRILTDDYGINPEKIIVVAHAVVDLQDLIHYKGIEEFFRPKNFAVVSEFLKQRSKQLGIKRIPVVLPLGLNTDTYSMGISTSLKSVGFAGSFHKKEEFSDTESLLAQPKQKKRGYLAEECASKAGLEFKVAQAYHNSFVTMPGFYKNVDCIIVASSEEGAGLPALEAGAAGKLVISTPVGHWKERCGEKGGHTVPIEEQKFIQETTKLLEFYKKDPKAYKAKCREIKEHSKSYDWSYVIDKWVKVLSLA